MAIDLSGSFSFPTVILSFLLVPSGAPQAVLAVATGSTSIFVQWDRVSCIHRNSEITGYTISYTRSGGNMHIMGTTRSDRAYTITGLNETTIYTIMVAADTNGVTTGLFSDPIDVATFGKDSLNLLIIVVHRFLLLALIG